MPQREPAGDCNPDDGPHEDGSQGCDGLGGGEQATGLACRSTPKSRHLGAHVFLSVEEGLSLGDRHVEHGGDVLDVTTSFPKGESPGPGTSGWYDPFACCLDIIDTDREDTHGIDDANPLQGPVTLPGEPSDGLAGDVREEGDDSPWDATFMNEGTDVEGEVAGVDPCCRRCRGL